MDSWQVAAALLSAALHAGWNAAVKSHARPAEIMTAQMVIGALLGLPALLWTGLPAAASLPWLAGSTCINLVIVAALLRTYSLIGFGTAYPMVRALSVMLVTPAATLLSGELMSGYGVLGIGLIVVSLCLLAAGNRAHPAVPRMALVWMMLAGLATAGYVLCDAQGVRRAGSPLAYGFVVSATNAAAMFVFHGFAARQWHSVAAHAGLALPIAMASTASYLLILWVWSQAPIAPASALRDTSSIFAIMIAIVWLHEPFTRLRLFAILLSAAAVPLLRMA
ncbi:EamA family transporter [Reyranella sp.]|uniref:EamA family transporter n=1 Tax=Reyranella sp. TaxID=1929291 RepID=UPI003D0D706E